MFTASQREQLIRTEAARLAAKLPPDEIPGHYLRLRVGDTRKDRESIEQVQLTATSQDEGQAQIHSCMTEWARQRQHESAGGMWVDVMKPKGVGLLIGSVEIPIGRTDPIAGGGEAASHEYAFRTNEMLRDICYRLLDKNEGLVGRFVDAEVKSSTAYYEALIDAESSNASREAMARAFEAAVTELGPGLGEALPEIARALSGVFGKDAAQQVADMPDPKDPAAVRAWTSSLDPELLAFLESVIIQAYERKKAQEGGA